MLRWGCVVIRGVSDLSLLLDLLFNWIGMERGCCFRLVYYYLFCLNFVFLFMKKRQIVPCCFWSESLHMHSYLTFIVFSFVFPFFYHTFSIPLRSGIFLLILSHLLPPPFLLIFPYITLHSLSLPPLCNFPSPLPPHYFRHTFLLSSSQTTFFPSLPFPSLPPSLLLFYPLLPSLPSPPPFPPSLSPSLPPQRQCFPEAVIN